MSLGIRRQPRRILFLLLFILSVAACDLRASVVADSSQGAADLGGADGSAVDSPGMDAPARDVTGADGSMTLDGSVASCAPIKIAKKQDLLAQVKALVWSSYSPSSAGALAISRPLTITGKVSLSSSDLSVPPGCTPGNTCMQEVLLASGISAGTLPAGVTFGTKASAPVTAYDSVTMAAVTVRLRAVVENVHPWTYNFVPIIRLEPDCASSCPGTQRMCPGDRLCYGSNLYCRFCLALDHKQCACHEFTAVKSDGVACSYISKTMSSLCQGQCKSGTCVYQGKPDVYCP